MNQSTEQQRRIAREYLLRVKDDIANGNDYLKRAKRTRLAYVKNARKYGLKFREIGDLLGITEAGVRMMLDRDMESQRKNLPADPRKTPRERQQHHD